MPDPKGKTEDAPVNGGQDQDQTTAQTTDTAPDRGGEHMVPRSRLNQEIEKRKASDSEIKSLVDELKEDIPEDMRDLVPSGLSPVEQLRWIRSATKKGLFSGGAQDKSGPDSKRPGGKPPTDLDQMSAVQMMETGYKS